MDTEKSKKTQPEDREYTSPVCFANSRDIQDAYRDEEPPEKKNAPTDNLPANSAEKRPEQSKR